MNVQVASAEVNRFANNERANFEAALKKLVDIPSVSMDPACKKDIARCAEAAAELLRSIGAKAEVVATRGNPVVYGELASGPGPLANTPLRHDDRQRHLPGARQHRRQGAGACRHVRGAVG